MWRKEQIMNITEQLRTLIPVYIQERGKPETAKFAGLAHPSLSAERVAQIMRVPDGWMLVSWGKVTAKPESKSSLAVRKRSNP